DVKKCSLREVLEQVAALLDAAPSGGSAIEGPPALTARDRHGVVRYYRYGQRATGWKVIGERIGAIKLENPGLYRKAVLCEAIEPDLMSVLALGRSQTTAPPY